LSVRGRKTQTEGEGRLFWVASQAAKLVRGANFQRSGGQVGRKRGNVGGTGGKGAALLVRGPSPPSIFVTSRGKGQTRPKLSSKKNPIKPRPCGGDKGRLQ